jgi:hypothetical protein
MFTVDDLTTQMVAQAWMFWQWVWNSLMAAYMAQTFLAVTGAKTFSGVISSA